MGTSKRPSTRPWDLVQYLAKHVTRSSAWRGREEGSKLLSRGVGLATRSLPEGWAVSYDRPANFERHVHEFIRDWDAEPVLERYIQQRMAELGVRPRQRGIIDDVETGSVFSMEHNLGGRNTKPGRAQRVVKGGINVDYGVFDPEHLPFASWRTASLRDRIDAVIVHEVYEYQSRYETTALRHQRAIRDSPATRRAISAGAREILADYRAWWLGQRRVR